MLNVMLTGIGGQGTVLAAKLLAQASSARGWKVRTAETIGMAQRGGSVISHVRMGNLGEDVHAPLIAQGQADLIVAFEPSEAARCLPYLAPGGTVVTATSPVQPVTVALSGKGYSSQEVIDALEKALSEGGGSLVVVDDAKALKAAGNRKALNVILLARALSTGATELSVDDLRQAIPACVKPQFVDMNLAAIDAVLS